MKFLYTHKICGYYQLLCNSLLANIVNNSNEVYRKAYGKSIKGISNLRNSLIHYFETEDEWNKRGIETETVRKLIHRIYHVVSREIPENLHDVLTMHLKIRHMFSELEPYTELLELSGSSIPIITNEFFKDRDDYEKLKNEFGIQNNFLKQQKSS